VSLQQTDHADDRRGVDRLAEALVIETDVARDHRGIEDAGGGGHTIYRPRHLVIHRRFLGIAEVEAVREGKWRCPGADDVARRLGDGQRASVERVEPGQPPVAIGRSAASRTRRTAASLPGPSTVFAPTIVS